MFRNYVRIATWNVNGIRAAIRKDFWNVVKNLNPDILAIQEVKYDKAVDIPLDLDYYWVWNAAERKGYSGTAFLIKKDLKPLNIEKGFGNKKFDIEGRTITLEYPKFYIVNSYFPNSQRELKRLDFKIEFNNALEEYINKLESKKPVILVGDFNVAHREIDLARPKQNEGNAGFTKEEREWIDSFLKKGWIDGFRYIKGDVEGFYTWWTYRFKAREKNIGWRIDYIIISPKLLNYLKDVFIYYDAYASDHVPVVADFDDILLNKS